MKHLKNKRGNGEILAVILIILFIIILVAPAVQNLGKGISSKYNSVTNQINTTLTQN